MIATRHALRGTLPGWPSVEEDVAHGGTTAVARRERLTLTVTLAVELSLPGAPTSAWPA
eukprot:CAMPEP_0181218410 /NCGR_PEP_ID=MMETSP1096-20121128/27682_1 /TAXON_ID=156174 ORGANISM="Chrysochromulina ericina, Strain CCMP281" /NCGR_SAMPLE_ID=MMETSP1096 /ASSEMBLY_ACC=CAM_ASM_000453 /LENGTH=58 /DNA_ID=CAMNT_0023310631 /DNA_START=503 /DNA_END=679 /DNA_ORIENTATION=-